MSHFNISRSGDSYGYVCNGDYNNPPSTINDYADGDELLNRELNHDHIHHHTPYASRQYNCNYNCNWGSSSLFYVVIALLVLLYLNH